MENRKVLHVFGGGVFVKYAVDIAKSVGWRVILRTGERFLNGLENYDKDDDVTVLVGNSLTALMVREEFQEKMISEYLLVRLGSYQRELLICFMAISLTYITNLSQNFVEPEGRHGIF